MADIRRKIILDGDASGAVAAGNQAAGVMDQFGNQVESLRTKMDRFKATQAQQNRQFDKLRMSYDKGYAAQKKYESASRTLRQAAKNQQWSQAALNAELEKVASHYGVAAAAGDRMNRTVRAGRFHTANLAAQFFDVGVMMNSGQSPFIMGVQQGAQFSQVLQTLGGTAKTQMAALVTAFKSVFGVTTLLSVGLVAGAGYLYQYLTRADEAKEKTEELKSAMERLAEEAERAALNVRKVGGDFFSTAQVEAANALLNLREREEGLVKSIARNQEYLSTIEEENRGRLEAKVRLQREQLEALRSEIVVEREKYQSSVRQLETEELILKISDAIGEAEKDITAEKKKQETANAKLIGQGRIAARVSQEMRNQMAEYQAKMAETFKSAAALNKELGEGAATMLTMAGMDITGPISEADKMAASLAARLGGALSTFRALQGGLINALGNNIKGGTGGPQGPGGLLPQSLDEVKNIDTYRYTPSEGLASTGGGGGGGSGGAATEDPIIAELERLQESLMTQAELEKQNFEGRQEVLQEALEKRLLTQQEYNELMRKAQEDYSKQMVELDQWQHMSTLQQTEKFFGDMASAMSNGNEQMQRIARVFGSVEALINAYRAFNQVLADPTLPWYAKIPAAMGVLAAGLKTVEAIKGSGSGGGSPTGSTTGTTGGGQIQQPPAQQRSLTLVGDRFNRKQAIAIAEFMNEGSDDGLVVRGRR